LVTTPRLDKKQLVKYSSLTARAPASNKSVMYYNRDKQEVATKQVKNLSSINVSHHRNATEDVLELMKNRISEDTTNSISSKTSEGSKNKLPISEAAGLVKKLLGRAITSSRKVDMIKKGDSSRNSGQQKSYTPRDFKEASDTLDSSYKQKSHVSSYNLSPRTKKSSKTTFKVDKELSKSAVLDSPVSPKTAEPKSYVTPVKKRIVINVEEAEKLNHSGAKEDVKTPQFGSQNFNSLQSKKSNIISAFKH